MDTENKLYKISTIIILIGIVLVAFIFLNSFLHGILGSKVPKNLIPTPSVVFPHNE